MICFIDFETTGIDIFRDEPIEIGAVLVEDDLTIVKEFSSFIHPNKSTYMTKRALNIHNIDSKYLVNAPVPCDVLNSFFNSIGTDYRLAGWNINFDVSFLRKLCNKNGMMVMYNKINYRHIDIQSIAYLAAELKIVGKELKSLSDWVEFFGFQRNQNHNALEDAKLTLKVYQNLKNLLESRITND